MTLREWCEENNKMHLLDEWDYEKNGDLTPDSVTAFSSKRVFWKCLACKGEWKVPISKRTTGRNCPYCSNKKVLQGLNDLETWCKKNDMEHLLDEWDYEKNKVKPNEVLSFSSKRIHWKCNICNGEWSVELRARTFQRHNCVYCSHQRVLKGFNDFETYCKKENRLELLKMWSPQNTILPSDVFPNTHKRVKWQCQNGHIWESPVSNMTQRDNDFCPKCFSLGVSFLEKIVAYYVAKYFDIKESYRPDFLNGKEIDIYIPSMKTGIEYDGKQWHKDADRDNIKNALCKEQGIQVIRIREYGLPKLSNCQEFELSKQCKNGFPVNFFETISKCLQFIGVETPSIDISRDYSDLFDFVKKTTSSNNLSSWCKDNNMEYLLQEWHPTKNGTLKPESIAPKSATKVYWECSKCGYEYLMSIHARTSSKQNCPRCMANNKLYQGYNDFETYCKSNNLNYLLKEWDYDKNDILPSEITAHNNRKAWWVCSVCKNSYLSPICHRSNGECNCPKCAGHRAVRCIETNTKYIGPTDAAQKVLNNKIYRKGIVRCCKGKQHTCGGYHWEYVDASEDRNNTNG